MILTLASISPYLAQAYGSGAYGSSSYQNGLTIGPFTLPSVGGAALALASLLALGIAVIAFVIIEHRASKRT